MALRSYQLALAAAAKRASDVYIDGTPAGGSVGAPNPKTDITYRELHFQAESAAIYVGMDSLTTSTTYGETAASGATLKFGPYDTGPLHLSDFYIAGNGATVHITGIPF